jgi:hypothetical protein
MMKKLLTSCLLLGTFVLPTKAVDPGTDMTSHILNAGFEGGSTYITTDDMHKPDNWTFTYKTESWTGSWVGSNGAKTVAEGVNYFNTWASKVTSYDIYQGINSLPGGVYTLTALMRVTSSASEVTNQHIYARTSGKIVCDSMTNTNIGDNLENWQKLTVEFTVSADGDSVYIGAASTGNGSSPAGWFQLDDFQLTYKMGLSEQAALEAMQANYNKKLTELSSLESSADVVDRSGFVSEIEDYANNLNVDINDIEAMKSAIAGIDSIISDVNLGIKNAKALEALITTSSKEAQETNYPGFETFQAALDKATAISSDAENSKTADYTNALTTLTSALRTYRLSQEASPDKPANYTFLISYPRFSSAASKAEETTSTVMSTGWVSGSTYTDGDQKANYRQCRDCWNAWWNVSTADAGTKNMDVHQVLSNLPTGYYSISCLAITQEGCLTDQHAYVTSTAGTEVSPNLATTGWTGDDGTGTGTWDSLATEKILVTDGNLTIGFTSTKANGNDNGYSGDNREGWWCVTQFQLNYFGGGDVDLPIVYNTKIAVATAMADTMHFAADKKALTDSIAVSTGATGTEAINKAMATLSNALVNATKSETYYAGIMAKGKTYPTLRDSLSKSGTAYGAANAIVKYAYDKLNAYVTASTTTYSTVDAFLTKVKKYTSDYATAYNATSDSIKGLKSAVAIKELNATLTTQAGILIASDTLYRTALVDTFITKLKKATSVCVAQDKYENGATDYTFLIQNPNAGGTSVNITGWVIKRGTGNTDVSSSGGQHYNGTTLCYFDSWNGTAGKLNYYGYQIVNNIPNGTYTMKVACRTSGSKGAFVFASNGGVAKSDTIWKRIELQKYYDAINDTTITADDERGSIWQAADDAVNAGKATDLQTIQASINNNTGRGWEWVSIEGIQVNNHQMVIGMCTDSLRTGEGFTGTWFSAVDFSIVKTADGDNSGWTGPITNINSTTILEDNSTINGIYSISGIKMSNDTNLPKGIYIIKKGNATKKIIVK